MSIDIAGDRVVLSASLVIPKSNSVSITPFVDDATFKLNFYFLYSDKYDGEIETTPDGEKGFAVTLKQRYFPGASFSSIAPISFAGNAERGEDYFVSIATHAVGVFETHTLVFNYTITARESV